MVSIELTPNPMITYFQLPPVYFKWTTMAPLEFHNILLDHLRECTPDNVGEAYEMYQRDLEAEMARKKDMKRFRPL